MTELKIYRTFNLSSTRRVGGGTIYSRGHSGGGRGRRGRQDIEEVSTETNDGQSDS